MLVAGVGVARVALGAEAPTDVVVGAVVGVTIVLLAFRLFTPDEAFPITYGRGRSAHLDVGGARGVAIRRGLEDQLGLVIEDVEPFGLAGSAGSTPLRITVDGEPPLVLFGKLYAKTHLRADRWYKLGRELLYGRLEDEKPYNSVRRLVQQEDYALSLMQRAGLPSPTPLGFVELTPEREYLLVTEFFDGAVELGDAEVDDQIIDDGLAIIRKLWDAGLAHRDIKPANLLVRDGRLLLIDVAFVEIRPSPWRQAVDLANMMLCLALRSDPERVYERALRQFTVDDVSEAFAAARSLALPSQLRHLLRAQGRDLHAEFVRLLPTPPRPIRIQRWSIRRIVLWTALVLLLVVISGQCPVHLLRLVRRRAGHRDLAPHRQPRLRRVGTTLATGPGRAHGHPGALRARPAGRLDGRQCGGQRRSIRDHPRPRPGRRRPRRGHVQVQRRLRRHRGGRGAVSTGWRATLPTDRGLDRGRLGRLV